MPTICDTHILLFWAHEPQRLVERFAPEQVILFGSMARGEAHWDSDADILVVMPFEGRSRDTVLAMRETCKPDFVQRCLETYLRAAMIALGIPSRKDRDLLRLSERLGTAIPGWAPDPEPLTILTQAALAYLDAGEGYPEISQDGAWAVDQAGPLRDCLRHWFAALELTC